MGASEAFVYRELFGWFWGDPDPENKKAKTKRDDKPDVVETMPHPLTTEA